MKPTLSAGLLIGLLCGLWMLVMGFTGWYKDPALLNAFYLVILIQIGVLVWALRQTAAGGKTYWQQVGTGTLMSVIGGAILFFVSLLFTTVIFPHYFEELRALHAGMLKSAGKSDAEIAAELEAGARMSTPFVSAISGFIGTVVTGLLASLVIAAFTRRKTAPAAQGTSLSSDD
jgi:hypothetical protein